MKNQRGFTYLGILIAVVILGVLLAQTGIVWSQAAKRDKEQELLFIGGQFRMAIALYYQRTPGAVKRYPKKLKDLVEDRRYNPPQHYLRRIYLDPMTNHPDWALVPAPGGGIMGIHSRSDALPLKKSGFSPENKAFRKAKTYSDWKFEYDPNVLKNQPFPS